MTEEKIKCFLKKEYEILSLTQSNIEYMEKELEKMQNANFVSKLMRKF